ncbi:enoyl-CoA hydratase/isomerase family protein [Nocardia sp. NPDC057663]|uniref:enoyl-CoA hydratase/isomerase family protein n=1 Tax=Nocardia sp. NPDC057663 TaxID=3346201 RepID=UPI00366DA452
MIGYKVVDSIAYVTLDRPASRNAFDKSMGAAFLEVATRIANDDGLRAVLITGNGPVFSVGGDIGAFSEGAQDLPDTLTRMALLMHEGIRLLARVNVPVVTAVQGACAGGALACLYAADITIAATGTKFATGFGRIGISADSGNTWYLPKFIGIRRASEMLFEDRVIDADTAAEWGLINRVVAPELVEAEAEKTVRRLAAGATRGYGEMRRLLHRSWTTTLDHALSEETVALRHVARTDDARGAIESFLNKQHPTFTGK